ncbi:MULTISPECIES: LysR substrate-binding domain-containing protein [unclassified Adlercreutzia]|uniref:LysR substrate-binding domain-containing protein n=1 Tax=unclassified Adlercreutzia TaxID=2636013 RepID=UPI0013EC30CB|nr:MULTISPECIES: LysR substrate-binding domain-containing protein [unclassified Adlercreutzia]
MSIAFSVSQQHYLFGVQTFAHTVLAAGGDSYRYLLRDTTTQGVFDDVSSGVSEVGLIMRTTTSEAVLDAAIAEAGLEFTELAKSAPRVALPVSHPLSNASRLSLDDLEDWPYIRFDQGADVPEEFFEEALSDVARDKTIICTDRATLSELATALNGYTVTSGILVGIADGTSLTTVELDTDVKLHLGIVTKQGACLSPLGERFVSGLKKSLERYARE